MQVTQNKCIHFCLKRNSRHHVGMREFREMNYLPTKEKVEQSASTKLFRYWKRNLLFSVSEVFPRPETDTKLDHIWLWKNLWKKVTYIERAFHFWGHPFQINLAMTWKF